MRGKCIICGVVKTENRNITLHKLPANEKKKDLWCKAINKDVIPSSAKVCSNHFKDSDYIDTSKKRLTLSAIPSVFNCDFEQLENCENYKDSENPEEQSFIIYYLNDKQDVFTIESSSIDNENKLLTVEECSRKRFGSDNYTCRTRTFNLPNNTKKEKLHNGDILDIKMNDVITLTEDNSEIIVKNEISDTSSNKENTTRSEYNIIPSSKISANLTDVYCGLSRSDFTSNHAWELFCKTISEFRNIICNLQGTRSILK